MLHRLCGYIHLWEVAGEVDIFLGERINIEGNVCLIVKEIIELYGNGVVFLLSDWCICILEFLRISMLGITV